MAKWTVHREYAELFVGKILPVGWVLKDEAGQYFYGEPNRDGERGIWIVLDREGAQDFADQLNGERDG